MIIDSFGEATNSFIIAKNCVNLGIYGHGIIDISGRAFLDYSLSDDDIKLWGDAAKDIPAKPGKHIRRPILFDNCDNVGASDIRVLIRHAGL